MKTVGSSAVHECHTPECAIRDVHAIEVYNLVLRYIAGSYRERQIEGTIGVKALLLGGLGFAKAKPDCPMVEVWFPKGKIQTGPSANDPKARVTFRVGLLMFRQNRSVPSKNSSTRGSALIGKDWFITLARRGSCETDIISNCAVRSYVFQVGQ